MAFLGALVPALAGLLSPKLGAGAGDLALQAQQVASEARTNATLAKSLKFNQEMSERAEGFSQHVMVDSEDAHENVTLENLALQIDGAQHKIIDKLSQQIT